MKKNMKIFKYFFLLLIVSIISVELILRWYGLHDLPTYREDVDYEYIHHPNQKRMVYRNYFFTNSFGMRSGDIDNSKRKILLIGDSVINGGNRNSNEQLASTIIQSNLGDSIQVLNVSSGSWGPDNGMQFIKKHGGFDAQLICLVFNSHDAGDVMDFKPTVNINPVKPGKNDKFALMAFSRRFLLPKIKTGLNNNYEEKEYILKETSELNPGWKFFLEYCVAKRIPLIVYLHAERNEWKKRKYNAEGEKIINFCKENNIKLVKDIDVLKEEYFSDGIHLNKDGQKMIADILSPIIEKIID
ncbi:hypothetical protein [Aquiflexum gelatinilyticum]|uniref:SGNH hydrolase-type esterase domain-containing protein n=1 Tax=Aquiflexum gelatinilyticum TaxID=2961943 RepID=A0A9X2P7X3_9BACT|nr:hypothetical protein [Aquiflexum gelatinilyticum]MCR9016486.1 hypothetical protein [Aquiflexum gelatinilyticum]